MKTIEESIEIDVPVSTASHQWTRFKYFPQFMEGVESVVQKDDRRLHWVAEIGGDRRSGTPRSPSSTPTIEWLGKRSTRRGRTAL